MEGDTPEHERAHIRQMVAIKRLASRVTREHDTAFKLLVQRWERLTIPFARN
ncbi:hypothetical protein PWP93_25160 [Paraburkholderia sp. A1RI-2L]|uniref:hypothetical protein n=1 Tax=Paraburkholderia sp. A1RI-2L TaxID=3028367 RepID=UPI003B7AA145